MTHYEPNTVYCGSNNNYGQFNVFVTEKIPVKIKITSVSEIRHYYNQC